MVISLLAYMEYLYWQEFSFLFFYFYIFLFPTKVALHKGTTDTKIKPKALKNGKGHFKGSRKWLGFILLCFVTNNSSTVN